MNNGKLFDHRVKCPGMLASKLTGLFGWRHTYRVHDRQKGINHYHNSHNLHKTYSLNLPPKRFHETTSSNPSLPEASQSSSSSVNTVMSGLTFHLHLQKKFNLDNTSNLLKTDSSRRLSCHDNLF